ncbi:pentapeptide repeat-containing protein [Desulfovibrio litoralis]|uniref:Uncharacterized protein YjbI, contains pentapeptide repeats n=1 Tax=Desulfovibrio litoralis DSM 11393 TaxID=1121455 RepID=A0A1M7TBV8_9BACT|nr:pentapeptide repeat-containing protein [Desulfovibrio litoralis]SHN68205.1 Uncharacterized protein YjbI, contains pentapeptide repeats [Desulfovibrio litoralis DSM 11393]
MITEEEKNAYFIEQNMRCNIEQYRLLKKCSDIQDLTEWNNWREENPDEAIVLQGANLKGFFLRGASFSYAELQLANFEDAKCQKANFENAECQWVRFFRAQCQGAIFWDTGCQHTNFQFTKCQETQFTDAKCQHANFWKANCQKADFRDAKCQATSFEDTECQGANFSNTDCLRAKFFGANCQGARLLEANLQETNFTYADCQGAKFSMSQCQESKFTGARLQGTEFILTQLQNTCFDSTTFDNVTAFSYCDIDRKTNFSSTSLSSVIIDPGRRALLERNIREIHWTKWYGETWWAKLNPKSFLTRFFWWLTDYGFSSKRILLFGFDMIVFFACIYTLFPEMLSIGSTKLASPNFFQMLAFSASTMVTLGFSNINVAVTQLKPSGGGMFWVTFNLMMGYFILAVLVTRIGILFQTLAPGYEVPEETDEETSLEHKNNANKIITGDVIWFFKLILYVIALYCIEMPFK